MKIGVFPETLLEALGLCLGVVPTPLLETHIATTLARAIMAGVELGLFEALEAAPLTGAELAARCATDPHATCVLADSLAASGYLIVSDGRYSLSRQSRRWLLTSSRQSIRDKILLQAVEWRWLAGLETFVRSGEPLDFHASMTDTERNLYHRSMRALAGIVAREAARRMPVPKGATRMLDLGGSHGHFAAEVCRRTPGLTAQVMDLPQAVEKAAPLLAAEGLGDRVVHVIGNVVEAKLGERIYDVILMSNLAHHLSDLENAALATRAAQALKPGGVLVFQEPVHPARPAEAGQTGALLGLYFALQSRPDVRAWTVADIVRWQTEAGLAPLRPVRLRTAPGWVQQSARR